MHEGYEAARQRCVELLDEKVEWLKERESLHQQLAECERERDSVLDSYGEARATMFAPATNADLRRQLATVTAERDELVSNSYKLGTCVKCGNPSQDSSNRYVCECEGWAVDEIERLRAVVADFEQTPGWREMQARIKFLEQVVGERECELEELRAKIDSLQPVAWLHRDRDLVDVFTEEERGYVKGMLEPLYDLGGLK